MIVKANTSVTTTSPTDKKIPVEHQDFFPIEITPVKKQLENNNNPILSSRPPIYKPIIIEANNFKLPNDITQEIWRLFLNDEEDADEDEHNKENDQNEPILFKIGPYKNIRLGVQLFHVFAPEVKWIKFVSSIKKKEDADENAEVEVLDIGDQLVYELIGGGIFNHLFAKQQVYLGNRGYERNKDGIIQLIYIGEKEKLFSELLDFKNSEKERIKYWYHEPEVTTVTWTEFITNNGESINRPINSKKDGEDGASSYEKTKALTKNKCFDLIKENRYRSIIELGEKTTTVYYADEPCWGSLLAEYHNTYYEYLLRYSLDSVYRTLEVTPGGIEPIGYIVTHKGQITEISISVDTKKGDNYYKYFQNEDDRIKDEIVINKNLTIDTDIYIEIIQDNEDEENTKRKITEDDYIFLEFWVDLVGDLHTLGVTWRGDIEFGVLEQEIIFYRLFNKAKFIEFESSPIGNIFGTTGKTATMIEFTPPTPDFRDDVLRDLPKLSIYEQRENVRIYSDPLDLDTYTEVLHKIEVTFIDLFGNITHEKLDTRVNA